MGATDTLKAVVFGVLAVIMMVVIAIVFFIIVLFIINFSAEVIFGVGKLSADYAVLSAVILTAATLVGGVYSTYE
ncbi:MAG: hypothetical protein GX224_05900 [Thermoplasmatales archaeon]|mgnify:CR=1 FL=1|nr:hypothetical protein [Thermoplasmatales archaeon]